MTTNFLLTNLLEVNIIHIKKLQFSYDNIDFEASVTYSDLLFSHSIKDFTSVFYDVKLLKPERLECGGEIKQIRGIASLMLFAKQVKDRHYDYSEDTNYKEDENIENVYPLAVRKILYNYFNKDLIISYKQKIVFFNESVDRKYVLEMESLREEKRCLKKRLRSSEITSKEYQKLFTPIRQKKDEIEFKIFCLKDRFYSRYFKCCELKARHCVFKVEKLSSCQDVHSLCRLIPHLANMQMDTKF